MAAHAAVGVHDDLAAGQAGVPHRSPGDEPAGGVDVILHADGIEDALGHDRLDHVLEDVAFDLLGRDVGAVLSRDHDRIHPDRFAVPVFHGHLGFPVWAYPAQDFLFPHLGQPLGQAMGQDDGHRHQLGRLVRGVAEHEALIAGSAGVHAHGDVGGLVMDRGQD